MVRYLSKVKIRKKLPLRYKSLIGIGKYKKILNNSKRISDISVIHINSSMNGGGVAELLRSQVPLEKGLGINSHWLVLTGDKRNSFFFVTKEIHNLLQGAKGDLSDAEKKLYFLHNKKAGAELKKIIEKIKPDIIVIHDPQPMPLIEYIPSGIKTILRLHIDLSSPNKKVLAFLKPLINKFDFLIVSHGSYVPKWISKEKIMVVYPAIDPFLAKNKILSAKKINQLSKKYSINSEDKIICQVSRFDAWKDPIGVIDAFNIARKKINGLKLILMGSVANDDPESEKIFDEVKKCAGDDKDITLLTKHNNELVNIVQSVSTVVLQKSIREGFGLTVTEAMWKKKPVIGGRTTGIAIQIKDKKNGFLVTSVKEAANLIIKLINSPKLSKKIGAEAHKTVKENFLMISMVEKHVDIYRKILGR